MNNLILCEGETDAILLSYYLQRTCGWRFVKKSPPGIICARTAVDKLGFRSLPIVPGM